MNFNKQLFIILLSLLSLSAFAQTNKKTLNYQAVILDPKAIDIPGASITGQPLNKGNVCLRFSLLNAQGGLDYEEIQQVTTDEYGLVNVAIGAGAQAQAGNSTSIYKSFDSVVWNSSVKSLKVSVSYDACSSFKQVSSQALNYTPYALYAEAVDYKNVREAPTKLSQFSNDAGFLIPKDLDPLKADIKSNTSQLATANQTIADNKKSSDATFLVVNQSISSLDKQVAENTNSITTINTKLTDQQNQITANNNTMNAQIGGLQGQLSVTNSTVSNLTGVAEMQSNKSTAVDLGGANPSDQAYPSQKAAKAYVDQVVSQIATSGVPDATTLAAGKVQLAGDLGGTATSPTVPALANKANIASPAFTGVPTAPTPASADNSTKIATTAFVQAATAGIALQAAVDAKANVASPAFTGTPTAPTPTLGDNSTKLATTAYVDAQVSAGAADASSSTKGIVKLTGDLGGTATSPTVPGLLLKEDLSNKSNGALGTSTTLYPTQNAVKTYVDAQVASATIVDADATTRGKIQLTGDLGGTASSPTVPGLALKANTSDVMTSLATKEDASNKSNASLGTSTTLFPTQNAVKTYVDAQIASATIVDADATTRGKIQLAGDLGGTYSSASAPVISDNAITSVKIANLAVTDAKIVGVSGSKVTGTVAVANGGTGTSTLTANNVLLGNGTSALQVVAPGASGNVLTSNGTTWSSTAPQNLANTISGQVQVANGGTGMATLALNGAIYASSATTMTSGTLPLTHGGTGVTSQQAAINALTGTQTAGRYLRSDGTDARLSAIQAADLPTLNQNTTGTAANVTGTVALANGGTGATTATAALTNLGAAPLASPTFTGTVTAPIYASAPQNLTDAATISWNPTSGLNANVTLGGNRTLSFSTAPASGSYGTLVITQDATGGRTLTLPSTTNRVLGSTSTTTVALSSAANARDILNFYFDGTTYFWNIGQGYGTAATITANNIAGGAAGSIPYQTGAGATGFLAKGNDGQILTLASGVPSWSNASATGVTSVAMTTPTGLTVSGSPITSSGTLALSLTSGYTIPLTSSQTNWDAAYTNRITSATSPLSITSNALSLGTVPVASGGTGVTTAPTNGQILIGNGTGFTLANLSPGTGITITNSSGSISIAAAVRPTTDQFSATANQLTFTLTQTPLTNANSLDNVWMFINGVRTNNLAYSVSGTTVTYVPGSNGSYVLLAGDRIQFDYAY